MVYFPHMEEEGQGQSRQSADNRLMEWEIPEFHKYPHGRRWYLYLGFVVVAIVAYALYTQNYIFALLTILAALIIVMHEVKDPRMIAFGITDKGVIIDNHLLPYKEIDRYWIVEQADDAQATLYVDFRSFARPRIAVPMASDLAEDVRDALGNFVPEDEDQDNRMPLSDRFGKWFKI